MNERLAEMEPPYEDVAFWKGVLRTRYGLDEGAFERLVFLRRGKKFLLLTGADHLPPAAPNPEAVGMPVMRLQHRYLKLTTQGAMYFGRSATRNVIELNRPQMDSYLRRESIQIPDRQVELCTGRGFVIVRYRGIPVGVALYLPGENPNLESLYPSADAIAKDGTAFPR